VLDELFKKKVRIADSQVVASIPEPSRASIVCEIRTALRAERAISAHSPWHRVFLLYTRKCCAVNQLPINDKF
jgi:hypothetical protein